MSQQNGRKTDVTLLTIISTQSQLQYYLKLLSAQDIQKMEGDLISAKNIILTSDHISHFCYWEIYEGLEPSFFFLLYFIVRNPPQSYTSMKFLMKEGIRLLLRFHNGTETGE